MESEHLFDGVSGSGRSGCCCCRSLATAGATATCAPHVATVFLEGAGGEVEWDCQLRYKKYSATCGVARSCLDTIHMLWAAYVFYVICSTIEGSIHTAPTTFTRKSLIVFQEQPRFGILQLLTSASLSESLLSATGVVVVVGVTAAAAAAAAVTSALVRWAAASLSPRMILHSNVSPASLYALVCDVITKTTR